MRRRIKKVLKLVGAVILIILIVVIGLFFYLSTRPFVPHNYTKTVQTGGKLEEHYLMMGNYEIQYSEQAADEPIRKYEIYYPAELETKNARYPAVVFVNGSGVPGSRYKALFRHLASWGFIVIGNEDPGTGTGISADQTLSHLLTLNEESGGIFYGKIDTDNIGISGHSQGGAGVLSAVSVNEHRGLWKTAVALSPTQEELAHQLGWIYDMEKIEIPLLMLSGTTGDFETQVVIPMEAMQAMYDKVHTSKAMARRTHAEHGHMLYCADGYVTAWLMWQLQGDKEAAAVFTGQNPELSDNSLYENQRIDIIH